MIVAACSSGGDATTTLSLSAPEATSTTAVEAETTTTTSVPTLWEVDTCLDLGTNADRKLPYAPYGNEFVIGCGGPHTHEFFFVTTVSEGADAPFPEDLNGRLWPACYAAFAERMGFPSSQSTLDLTLYLPDDEEWDAGERYHGCVLHQPGTQVPFRPIVGSVFDHPDDYRWEVAVGSCFAEIDLSLLLLAEAVPCEEIHTVEMIGEVELAPQGTAYPGLDEVIALGEEACQGVLDEYATQDVEELSLVAFAHPPAVEEGEWDVGGRSVKCFVLAGNDEQGLLLVRGSVGDGTAEVMVPDDSVSA